MPKKHNDPSYGNVYNEDKAPTTNNPLRKINVITGKDKASGKSKKYYHEVNQVNNDWLTYIFSTLRDIVIYPFRKKK